MTRNTTTRWGWPSKTLHWIGALIVLILITHGWWMTHVTPLQERLVNFRWHAALGYDLLALTIVRLLWRWTNPVPAPPADLKPWERLGARVGHFGLYVLLLMASLTGWVLAGTFHALVPILMNKDLLGVSVPSIASFVDHSVHGKIQGLHMILAYVLAALVVVHVVGALRHHFAKKNDVIRRMTWNGSENVDGSEGLIAIPRMTHRVPVWLHRTFTAGTSAHSASAHPTTEGGRTHVEPS